MSFASYPALLRSKAAANATIAGCLPALVIALAAVACARGGEKAAPPADVGVVEGAVLDPAGRPLADVPIELGAQPADGRVPVATTRTTAAGTFRMERIPAGRYLARARPRSFAVATAAVAAQAGTISRTTLRVQALVALAGRIQDDHGTPVPMAHVLAFAVAEASAPTFHEARADAAGRFTLRDLTAGTYRLLIDAPGLGTASAGPVAAPDPDVVIILPGESRSVTGLVTRQGHPAARVRVHLGGDAVFEPRVTETDAAGRFAFPGLGPGTYALRAESGDLVSPVVSGVAVGVASQLRQVDLELAPAGTVHGRVVDDRGAALADATVRMDLIPATGLWPPLETDGAGAWTSPPLPPGKYLLRARRPGFTARRTSIVEVTAGGAAPASADATTLVLVRTGEISGRVVTDDGAPVAGARVQDRSAAVEQLGVVSSSLPGAAAAAALPPGARPLNGGRAGTRQVTTGADGRFVLTDVPPGRLRLEILQPSLVPYRGKPLVLPPDGHLDLGALVLSRAALVMGRVSDADGTPVGGARVAVRPGDGAGAALYAVTGVEGDFALPLPPGDHTLVASREGRPEVSAPVHVIAGRTPETVTLRFARAGTRVVTGVIKDGEGRPLAAAHVAAVQRSDGEGAAGEPAALATAIADPGGHFKLTGLPDSALRLEIRHPRYAPHHADVTAARGGLSPELVIRVPVPGAITGEVHERVTGGPVASFQIEAEGPDGAVVRFPQPGTRASRRAGPFHFALGPLAPGQWRIRVRAAGYTPVERRITVPAAPSPGEPSVRDLRLELARAS